MADCALQGRYRVAHTSSLTHMQKPAGHLARRERLQMEFAASDGAIGLRKPTSTLFRHRNSSEKRRVDVREFNHVLSIDRERRVAEVEGMTTYEILVNETLKYGLLPAVVPQLKTITVGGAVSGLGIESSSFRYGLVHETVESMDVLLADGRIVSCSCNVNPNLFFGFPNSYGTLGYAIRLTIRLIPAKPFVRLAHLRFSDPRTYFAHIQSACERGALDYLDGTIFAKDEMYATQATLCQLSPRLSDYTFMNVYYQSIREKSEDWMTAKDYIWRWDTDWFWCSRHFGVQNPAIRWLAKPWLNSRSYQRVMRLSQKHLRDNGTKESVIQDVDIPIDNAVQFFEFLLAEIPITPIWVCPFITSDRTWDLCPLPPGKLYINFGFWDVVSSVGEPGYYNRKIENKAREFGGAKGLYSSSYYDQDTFWSIYNRQHYEELKSVYDPRHQFPDLYEKCVKNR